MRRIVFAAITIAALLAPAVASAQYFPPGAVDFSSTQLGIKLSGDLNQVAPNQVIKGKIEISAKINKFLGDGLQVAKDAPVKIKFSSETSAKMLLPSIGKSIVAAYDKDKKKWVLKKVQPADKF